MPFHLLCQQPTSCRPCMPSQQSCKDWQWSSSGCMGILTCMVVIYQVRKIITGERCNEGFWRCGGATASSIFLHIPSFFLLNYCLSYCVLSYCPNAVMEDGEAVLRFNWGRGDGVDWKLGPNYWHRMQTS